MHRPVQRRPPSSTASRTRSGVRAKNAGAGPAVMPDTIARRRQLITSPLWTEATMPERPLPSEQEVLGWIRQRRNWGRWGKDDQIGALNLVTPAKRAAAARLGRNWRINSLS